MNYFYALAKILRTFIEYDYFLFYMLDIGEDSLLVSSEGETIFRVEHPMMPSFDMFGILKDRRVQGLLKSPITVEVSCS